MTPFRILVVCTANICRSPMAEHLLRDSLVRATATSSVGAHAAYPEIRVSSAGVRGWDGAEMDPPAAAALLELGGDPAGFRARSFTVPMGERADLILTATRDHRRLVLEAVPRALHRTFTLVEFAHLVTIVDDVREARGDAAETVRRAALSRGEASIDDYDIDDPFGQPPDVHRLTGERLLAISGEVVTAVGSP